MNRIVSNNKSGFEFKPGYHEWNLFKKNKLLYTFSDFTELLFSYELRLKKAVELLVDELIEENLTPEDKKKRFLANQMELGLQKHNFHKQIESKK